MLCTIIAGVLSADGAKGSSLGKITFAFMVASYFVAILMAVITFKIIHHGLQEAGTSDEFSGQKQTDLWFDILRCDISECGASLSRNQQCIDEA